jgi:hypothetical protein
MSKCVCVCVCVCFPYIDINQFIRRYSNKSDAIDLKLQKWLKYLIQQDLESAPGASVSYFLRPLSEVTFNSKHNLVC